MFLLIDRDECTLTVHSNPESGRYSDIQTAGLGNTVELPGLGITLGTEVLKNHVR